MVENPSSNTVAGDQLRAFIERLERLDSEIKGLNEDKSDIFKEAKGNGFDVKVIRKVIGLRKLDTAERQEQAAILDMYLAALGID